MKRLVQNALACLAALSAAALFAVVAPSSATGEPAAEKAPGQQVFEKQKCNMCHDVSAVSIKAKMKAANKKGPDLTGIGSRRESDWIAQYIRKEVQLDGKDHKKDFQGTDDDLTVLIDWMLELEAPSTGEGAQ